MKASNCTNKRPELEIHSLVSISCLVPAARHSTSFANWKLLRDLQNTK